MKARLRPLPSFGSLAVAILSLLCFEVLAAGDAQVPSNAEIVKKRIADAEKELNQVKADIAASRAQLRHIEQDLVGTFESDSRLVVVDADRLSTSFEKVETKYWLDGRPIALGFDDFISQGNHQLQVDKTFRVKGQIFRAQNTFEFVAAARQTTIVEATVAENKNSQNGAADALLVEFKSSKAPNNKTGHSLLAAQDLGASIPLQEDQPWLIVSIVNKMDHSYRLVGRELILDKNRLAVLERPLATGEGEVVFEGALSEGYHRLDARLTYESSDKNHTHIKSYQYEMKFHRTFTVKKGAITRIELVGAKK